MDKETASGFTNLMRPITARYAVAAKNRPAMATTPRGRSTLNVLPEGLAEKVNSPRRTPFDCPLGFPRGYGENRAGFGTRRKIKACYHKKLVFSQLAPRDEHLWSYRDARLLPIIPARGSMVRKPAATGTRLLVAECKCNYHCRLRRPASRDCYGGGVHQSYPALEHSAFGALERRAADAKPTSRSQPART
jgi:hypothetical protein